MNLLRSILFLFTFTSLPAQEKPSPRAADETVKIWHEGDWKGELPNGWKIEGPDGAAKILGLHPSTLRTRMQKLGIQIRRPDPGHGRGEEAAVSLG